MYIWELPDWPHFRWSPDRLLAPLATAHFKHGLLLGEMRRLGIALRLTAEVEALTEEAVKSAAIEGEALSPASVRSSVARRLGVADAALAPPDRRVEGMVEMMLDATKNFAAPLTAPRLCGWQAALFPTGRSGLHEITVGAWRRDARGPMQVVSGGYGRERVHFEAPPAERLDAEMTAFIDWFEAMSGKIDSLVHAAFAHLWFVTIHPFDDGNGRVARALTDMSLARAESSAERFYSLASAIRADRRRYYAVLERTQKGDLDITEYLAWFVETFTRAVDTAQETCEAVLRKAGFWQRVAQMPLNERQHKVLNRVLDGFEGKLTAQKWKAVAKTSLPTAQRDIKDLVDRGLLLRNEGGSKNTSYRIAEVTDGDVPA